MGPDRRRLTGPAGALVLAIAYGAGLATGLARFPDPFSVGIAALSWSLLSRRPELRIGAGCFLVGLLVAVPVRWWSGQSCIARFESGRSTLRVKLIDPGGGIGRVKPVAAGCHGGITAWWPVARAIPAGVTVEVTGSWLARSGGLGRPDGTLYIDRIGPISGSSPGWLARSRNAAADRSGRLFGDDAPLVDALVAGRRGALPDQLVDDFARTGLIHLLVISGSHIGVVAGWVALIVVLIGLPRRWGGQAGSLAAICYAAWLGWPAPATRAAALIAVLTWGRLLQRRWRPSGALGVSALVVLLIDPWAMTRIGAWLSFLAVAGVLWATRWSRRAWSQPSEFREVLAASVGATLTTAPIAAWGFGRVAPIGVILNFAAIPLAAIAVPALAGALLLDSVLPELARAFAASATVLLHLMVALGHWGSTLPGAATEGPSGVVAALPWLTILAITWLATRRGAAPREAARRFAWGAATFGLLSLAQPVQGPLLPPDQLVLSFLDVGQGDAAAIRTPGGHWLLVDAGPASDRYDAGRRIVVPYLRHMGVTRIELMAISHAHRDHAGGAAAVLGAIPVGVMIDPGEPVADPGYRGLLQRLAVNRTRWQVVGAGTTFEIDGVTFRIVHPETSANRRSRDLNEESIVIEVRWRDFTALLAGDAGIVAESNYVANIGSLDLLKVGHHGSRSATGRQLLRHSPPDAAVISLGRNHYGHPDPELLARLAAAGTALWRTDQEGPVTLTTDGHTFTLRGERSSRTFTAADP